MSASTARCLLAFTLLACSSPDRHPPDEPPARAPEAPKPAASKPPAAEAHKGATDRSHAPSAAERLIGTWVLNLNDAPTNAVAKDFQRFKKSEGLAGMVKIEYIVTDTEWIMEKKGAGGVFTKSWHYQILQEIEDTLFLERIGDDGHKERIRVTVGTDELVIGIGQDPVPLHRKK